MRLATQLSGLLAALIAAACSSAAPGTAPSNPVRKPGSPEAVAAAVVAAQTGSPAEAVQILSVEAMEFADSSLGCPQPDMAYMQVITPGYKIMAALGNRQFDVRVARGRGYICAPTETVPR